MEEIKKGGKRAQIGETRIWGGTKYIKHQDGWVAMNKQGTGGTLYDTKSGKKIGAAEQHHLDHFKQHSEGDSKKVEEPVKEKKMEGKVIGHTKSGGPIYEEHNTKEHGRVTLDDYQRLVPGYITLPEFQKFQDAEDRVNNWGVVTQHNKAGYDQAQHELAEASKAYRVKLHSILSKNSRSGSKKEGVIKKVEVSTKKEKIPTKKEEKIKPVEGSKQKQSITIDDNHVRFFNESWQDWGNPPITTDELQDISDKLYELGLTNEDFEIPHFRDLSEPRKRLRDKLSTLIHKVDTLKFTRLLKKRYDLSDVEPILTTILEATNYDGKDYLPYKGGE